MLDELNRIINYINSKNDWDKNTKMRYAYVELGKLLHKDSFFFYTIQNNLLNGKEELQYDIDTIDKMINSTNSFDYKVICKNSADMLKYIFDHTGIDCEIRRTTKTEIYKDNDKEVQINHYFIVATGNDNKKYFMTLNPDLHNIQISKRTSHFGNIIPYIQTETIEDENGNKVKSTFQAYEGEEIEATPLSFEELRELDEKIGYQFINYNGTLVYADDLFDILEEKFRYNQKILNDGEYFEIIRCETPFYYDICNLLNKERTLDEILESNKIPSKKEINDSYIDYEKCSLEDDTLNDLKIFVLLEVIIEIYNKYNLELDEHILDEYKDLLESKEYDKMQEFFTRNFSNKNYTNLGPYNPIVQFKKTTNMIKIIDSIMDINDINERKKCIKDLHESLKNVLLIFVPDSYLPSTGKRLNSSYITNKIIKSFEKVFDIGHIGEFNNLELAEQVEIIKEILARIFTDSKLNVQDPNIVGYRKERSPLKNRIYSTVLFNKETNDPYYLMIVRNSLLEKDSKDGLVPIVFDLKRNTLSTNISMTDIYDSYFIIKDQDFKLMIEQIEKEIINK